VGKRRDGQRFARGDSVAEAVNFGEEDGKRVFDEKAVAVLEQRPLRRRRGHGAGGARKVQERSGGVGNDGRRHSKPQVVDKRSAALGKARARTKSARIQHVRLPRSNVRRL
jgi:hypothetical protein